MKQIIVAKFNGRRLTKVRPLLLLVVSISIYILLFFYLQKYWTVQMFIPRMSHSPPESYVIDTEGCRILDLKPFDDFVAQHVFPEVIQPICDDPNEALLRTNASHIWIDFTNLKYYNSISLKIKSQNLMCCYKTFHDSTNSEDLYSESLDCVNFTNVIAVGKKDEFVFARCYIEKEPVYAKLFLFAPKKDSAASIGNEHTRRLKRTPPNSYNVLIVGIDNVSRLNFHRTMNKTLSYIKGDLGAIEFYGYNKVGDNTIKNVVPILTGLEAESLEQANKKDLKDPNEQSNWIWSKYKNAGYYTAFGEDVPSERGAISDFKELVKHDSFDYHTNTFMRQAFDYKNVRRTIMKYGPVCVQDRYTFEIILDYIEVLSSTLSDQRMFGFFWEVSFSHYNYQINYPLALDPGYKKLFSSLHASGYLNDTIVLFLSDHGLRNGPVAFTERGRLETRLPFLYFVVPQSFRENYKEAYENLKLNSRRLTTPYDVHETLRDLVNMRSVSKESIDSRLQANYYTKKRGISLFMPIPTNRTCRMAGIEYQWCTCFKMSTLSIYGNTAINTSVMVLQHLNDLLNKTSQCAVLQLDVILEIVGLLPTFADTDKWKVRLMLRTVPGGGVFEATLIRSGGEEDSPWMLAGQVGRLDPYGDQSHCVEDPLLKLYCYCLQYET